MAILQRTALYPQMRLDVPDARAIEAFAQNDWQYFIKGVLSNKSSIISGFDITNYQNIFTVPGVQLSQNNVSFLHPEASTQAAGFYVSSGSEADFRLVLSSNNSSTTTNYVEADLSVTTGSPDVRAFWDAGANGGQGAEFTDTVDTVINLSLSIDVNISGFTAGRIPLYRIVTNPDGTVNTVTDCRPMLFRLGTGGTSPDPDAEFLFPESPDSAHARLEPPSTAKAATLSNAPFLGGDKNFKNLKNWMDAVMTSIKEIKATPYWYSKPATSPTAAYQNAAMTLLQGGKYEHLASAVGHLKMTGGSVIIRMGTNNSSSVPFANVDLTTNDTLFVLLSPTGTISSFGMGEDGSSPIIPKDVTSITSNSLITATGGNYRTTGGKLLIRGQAFTYTTYNATTGLFSNVSPDPSQLVKVSDTVFQEEVSGAGYYHAAPSARLPGLVGNVSEGAERVFWIAHFDGVNTIFVRDAVLIPGESAKAGDANSDQTYQYIGSTGAADNFPVYDVHSIPNGTNLTDAIESAFNIIETPIYDEVITDTMSTGWANGTTLFLPTNSKTSTPGAYSQGTDELQVYENGILLRNGYDYTEQTSTSIQLLRDVYTGSYFRFRISSIGGAGAAAGTGSAGQTLQGVYNNGRTVTVAPSSPIVINGPAGQKLLHVQGDVQIDGLLDPTGLQLTPQASTPLPMGQLGFWIDSASEHIMFTRADGTHLQVGAILEKLQGSAPNFSRSMKNNSGVTIPAGTPVFMSATNEIYPADADNEEASRFFGFTTATCADQAMVNVIFSGVVPGLMAQTGLPTNTRIWLTSTPGLISEVPPTTPGSYQVQLGLICGDDLILQIQSYGQVV
jgi:hypothetical protein